MTCVIELNESEYFYLPESHHFYSKRAFTKKKILKERADLRRIGKFWGDFTFEWRLFRRSNPLLCRRGYKN